MKFVCDRGVSHEVVRHRVASFAQESTRYCNYGLEKFGGEITVVRPSWCSPGYDMYDDWKAGCYNCEGAYFTMLANGATPQQARGVLPTDTKTEIVVTMNLANWDHFFGLRCDPAAHPNMREVAMLARELYITELG
jgi:thymidylate synthase (FAD)